MKEIKIKKNPCIKTYNRLKAENGFLIPVLNFAEGFLENEQWPKQIYCTVAKEGEIKGPHLHKIRWGLFTCIKGDIKIVVRIDGKYHEYLSGEHYEYSTIQVPAGIPSALVNIGAGDAYILNMPSPAWSKEAPDDWDVQFDDYNFTGRTEPG